MDLQMFTRFSLLLTLLFFIGNTSHAVQIVRFDLVYDDNDDGSPTPHTVYVELFDDVAPNTVANFLDYVSSGEYEEIFINRSVEDFVLQTGGYTFKPTDPDTDTLEDTGATNVEEGDLSPVINEFNLSNLRGTLAMAKRAFDPHSATNEWFINLEDNVFLDEQNAGFTVFGKVIDNGMDIATHVATYPTHPTIQSILGGAFDNLPVVNYSLPDAVLRKNLVMLNAFNVVSRPVLRLSTTDTPTVFDVAADASVSSLVVSFINTGDEALQIDSISAPASAEFSLSADNCTSALLDPVSVTPSDACTLTVQLQAGSETEYSDTIDFNYHSTITTNTYTVTIPLFGEGVPSLPTTHILPNSVAFNNTDLNGNNQETVTITNKGGGNLNLSSLTLTGADASEFSLDNAGCATTSMLATGEHCELAITFTPTATGSKDIALDVDSNAATVQVDISASAIDPQLDATPNPGDFGEVGITQTEDLDITVTNTGQYGLALETFTFSGADADAFSFLTNCPSGAMNSNQSCIIRISFTNYDGYSNDVALNIRSNDADTPVLSIPLTASTPFETLFSDTDEVIFETDYTETETTTINVINISSASINIDTVSLQGTDSSQFTLNQTQCTNGTVLAPGEDCEVEISFTANTADTYTANLHFSSSNAMELVIPVNAEGIKPIINTNDTVEFGPAQVNGDTISGLISITNTGNGQLEFTNQSIAGSNASQFIFSGSNCPGIDTVAPVELSNDTSCLIEVLFSSAIDGYFTATLTLESNDPDTPSKQITLLATAEGDVDGISNAIEDSAPNSGDNNNDDIQDSIQNNVASYIMKNFEYATIASTNTSLSNTPTQISHASLVDPVDKSFSAEKNFSLGGFSTTIDLGNVFIQESVDIAIILPNDITPESIYMFGPTTENTTPHVYQFEFDTDSATGVIAISKAQFQSPNNENDVVERNIVILRIVDGGYGDADMQVDGKITINQAAIAVASAQSNTGNKSASSSGSQSILTLLLLAIALYFARQVKTMH